MSKKRSLPFIIDTPSFSLASLVDILFGQQHPMLSHLKLWIDAALTYLDR
jgi:hypothetical protein